MITRARLLLIEWLQSFDRPLGDDFLDRLRVWQGRAPRVTVR